MEPHANARRLQIEHPAGLVGVHVEPVHEDQRRSQAVGKLLERSAHVVAVARRRLRYRPPGPGRTVAERGRRVVGSACVGGSGPSGTRSPPASPWRRRGPTARAPSSSSPGRSPPPRAGHRRGGRGPDTASGTRLGRTTRSPEPPSVPRSARSDRASRNMNPSRRASVTEPLALARARGASSARRRPGTRLRHGSRRIESRMSRSSARSPDGEPGDRSAAIISRVPSTSRIQNSSR